MNMISPDREQAETDPALPATGRHPAKAFVATQSWRDRCRMALADLAETRKLWPLVVTLSFLDIRVRYRGSMLGPFWLTMSTAVMVASIGFLYAHLFHQNAAKYLPFLSISLVLWNFFSTLTSDGCICYTQAESMIRSMRMPLSLHAARVVMRNILVLAHNLVVIAAVFVIFRIVPSLASFSVIPACALWAVDAMALTLLLGIVGARFRDIPPIVGSIVQIAFYLTPVIWSPEMLAHRGISLVLVQGNPFYALLEIVRGPLLGQALDPGAWEAALGYSALLLVLAGLVFTRARARIAYWV